MQSATTHLVTVTLTLSLHSLTIMAELGLSLVGTRPPSATGSRPTSSTGYHYPPTPKTPKQCHQNGTTYEDCLFGSSAASGDRTSTWVKTHGTTCYTDKSTTDNPEPLWQPPWHTDKKSKPLLYGGTDYKQAKTMLSGKSRAMHQRSVTSGTATRSRSKYGNKHTPSYVDETLFGSRSDEPSFAAPWDKTKEHQYVFDATDYKAVAERKAATAEQKQVSQDRSKVAWRPAGSRPHTPSSTRPSSSKSQIPKNKHHAASYVDDTLFGPRMEEPSFPAPWDSKKTKRPDLFSTTDYKAGPSIRERRQQESARGSQRPAWK